MKRRQIAQMMADIKMGMPADDNLKELVAYEAKFFDHSYKNKREWLILGSVAACMKNDARIYPEFAIKQSPPDPDFLVTFSDGEDIPIEITECLSIGYKRHDYYRGRQKSQACQLQTVPVESPMTGLAILQNAINKKSKKLYAEKSIMVVYFSTCQL